MTLTGKLLETAARLYTMVRPGRKEVSIEDKLSGIVGLDDLLQQTGTSFETASRIGMEESDWPTYGCFGLSAMGVYGFRSIYSGPEWSERVVMRLKAGLLEQPARAPYFGSLYFWLPPEYRNRFFDSSKKRWVE